MRWRAIDILIVAVAIGIILGRRRAARSEAIDPEEAIGTIVETTI